VAVIPPKPSATSVRTATPLKGEYTEPRVVVTRKYEVPCATVNTSFLSSGLQKRILHAPQ
ncbi:MAG TPA: hypothetical protein VIL26_05295, partial [Clostridia bacterium]